MGQRSLVRNVKGQGKGLLILPAVLPVLFTLFLCQSFLFQGIQILRGLDALFVVAR